MKKVFNKEYFIEKRKNNYTGSWVTECDGKSVDEDNKIDMYFIHDSWCDFIDDNGDKYRLIKLENEEL